MNTYQTIQVVPIDEVRDMMREIRGEIESLKQQLRDESDGDTPVSHKIAAKMMGVSETTVRNWLREKPNFGRVIEGKKVVTVGDVKRVKKGKI